MAFANEEDESCALPFAGNSDEVCLQCWRPILGWEIPEEWQPRPNGEILA